MVAYDIFKTFVMQSNRKTSKILGQKSEYCPKIPEIFDLDFFYFLDLKINFSNFIIKADENHSKMNWVINEWYHAMNSLKFLCNPSEKPLKWVKIFGLEKSLPTLKFPKST